MNLIIQTAYIKQTIIDVLNHSQLPFGVLYEILQNITNEVRIKSQEELQIEIEKEKEAEKDKSESESEKEA